MTDQRLNAVDKLSFLLPLVMLSSCIVGPDFSQSSDRAALEAAYRQNSEQAARAREAKEASAIEKLEIIGAGDVDRIRVSASLNNASRARVINQILAQIDVNYQIDAPNLTGRLSSRFVDKPLIEGLNLLLTGTGLMATEDSNSVRIGYSDAVSGGALDPAAQPAFITREIDLHHLAAPDAVRLLTSLYQSEGDFTSNGFTVESLPELNAIFVSGPPNLVFAAQTTIIQADRPAPHIIIEALVVDIDTSTVEALGVSFAEGASGKFSALDLVPGQTGGNIVGTFSDLATNAATVGATRDFLVGRNAAEVLARPYITSRSTQPATIEIVNDQFARVNTTSDDSSIISTDSVSAGVTMSITPTVLADDAVRLDIALEESRFAATAGDIIISKQRNTASSSMDVKSGQTIVIRGLNSKYRLSEDAGLPWLRNIPILNLFAGEQGAIETRRQLVVYITPYIWIPGQELPFPLQDTPDPILPPLTGVEKFNRRQK